MSDDLTVIRKVIAEMREDENFWQTVARLIEERDEARKVGKEYYDYVRDRWRGYAATLQKRYDWVAGEEKGDSDDCGRVL